ncbi:hypothetical protein DH2020_032256 [Rehmannia glutinosa]|uniref:Endonuclease/exonuclease/phosphatase domain-containing protein n=1 Tax=Rehmannia glutinosa TaxID=99300 RepID=A0ABR0VJ90_REHGL
MFRFLETIPLLEATKATTIPTLATTTCEASSSHQTPPFTRTSTLTLPEEEQEWKMVALHRRGKSSSPTISNLVEQHPAIQENPFLPLNSLEPNIPDIILAVLEPMINPDFPFYCRALGFAQGIANTTNKIWIFIAQDIDFTVYASFIYAKCSRYERRPLWDTLRTLANQRANSPWLVGGDFNCFLSDSERHGGNTDRTLDMEEFSEMVTDSGLIDLGYEGDNNHTWVRNTLQERLDRIFVNTSWGDVFNKSMVSHLPRIHSDHAPLYLQASSQQIIKVPSAFRYHKMWARHPTFLTQIQQIWDPPTGMQGMPNLAHKLVRVKQRLKWWNKNTSGNIFENLKEAEQKVATAKLYDSNPSTPHLISLKQAIAELTLATTIEEDFWHQKSVCKWVVEGERNTKYFHNMVNQKRIKSKIFSIMDNGNLLTLDADIQKSAALFLPTPAH